MANKPQSRRERSRQKRQSQKRRSQFIWGAFIIGALAFVGYAAWQVGFALWRSSQSTTGETAELMESILHVDEGTPVDYNTDPPTSGEHYARPLPAGFFEDTPAGYDAGQPQAHIVHSMEHGYVIFWYNCEIISENECTDLKEGIQSVMSDFNFLEVIAFPWNSIDVPLVMTSWGQIQPFESFDHVAARDFVTFNQNKSPEAQAP
ncbi:MAG: DUF3105 domain-containing protein [Chloroflexi bacterium]|nr:MAG: DUF3105 domain-containing protein [Chloroflexota bacterium]MBL1196861.1 DUF3105 domain-containing protein [Chloroflexota bacterium]NOH14157.1 DUF3105 domain-containing protein [Chloroflexota bacterium]